MFCFRNLLIVFYWLSMNTITMTIQQSEYKDQIIKCYVCKGSVECGISFNATFANSTYYHIESGDKLWNSCSIMVSPKGDTPRDLVPTTICRSSPYQYCCKESLCNSLLAPPLPAFTNLPCILDANHRSSDDVRCNAGPYIVFRSSPAESCSVIQQNGRGSIYKLYQKTCSPDVNVVPRDSNQTPVTVKSWCCNSFNCNQQALLEDVAIQCYVCDSRFTASLVCDMFLDSAGGFYKSGASSRFESCAMIVGLAEEIVITHKVYSSFVIRTLIANCTDQPAGNISYGGANFFGRIFCCSTDYCNNKSISPLLDKYDLLAMENPIEKLKTTTTTMSTELAASNIERITKHTKIKTDMVIRSKNGFYSFKTIISFVLTIILICVFTIIIPQIVRHFTKNRRYSSRNSIETIPIASLLDPSTSPFTYNTTEL